MREHLSFVCLLALPTVACLDKSSGDDAAAVASDLEKTNGGFTTTDEAPAFGEEAAYADADIEADTAIADPMAADPTVTALDHAAATGAHNVLVMWGKFPADPSDLTPRDWSGTLTVSRGALVVRRTVAFEDATDRLLPRTSTASVAFQSVTRPRADGLALAILDPDPTTTAPLTLTYAAAGGASYSLDLAALEAGPLVIDAGQGDKLIAIAQHRAACDGGFMRGRWRAVAAHAGVYLGLVTDRDGQVVGHVRGIYGERRNGEPAMFGKFIDREGAFRGLLVGTYADGAFHARWIDRAGDHGVIRGLYFEAATAAVKGAFLARWAETSCAQDQP